MAQSGKGVSLTTYTTGFGPRDTSGSWQPLAFKSRQAELTFLVLGATGSHILSFSSLTGSEDHLSRGFSRPSSDTMIPGPLLGGRGHRSTSNKTGLICLFYLTCWREPYPSGSNTVLTTCRLCDWPCYPWSSVSTSERWE